MEETTLLKLDKVDICREENVILHRASFTLHNGEFVYVIGKVGSGKSSLLKSLYCEIPINQGDAWLLDYNLCKMRRKDIPYLRRKLGIVFQDFQLLTDRSVHKNLEFVLKATGWKKKSEINERINNVLFQVGMQDKGYKMPHELSGGEQHRDRPRITERSGFDPCRRTYRKPGPGDKRTNRTAATRHLPQGNGRHHDDSQLHTGT